MTTLSPRAQAFDQEKAERLLDEASDTAYEARADAWYEYHYNGGPNPNAKHGTGRKPYDPDDSSTWIRRNDPSHVHRFVEVADRPGAPRRWHCFDCDESPRVAVRV